MLRHALLFFMIGLSFDSLAGAERFQNPWRVVYGGGRSVKPTPRPYIDSKVVESIVVDRRYGSKEHLRSTKQNSTEHMGDMFNASVSKVYDKVSTGMQDGSASKRDGPESRHFKELEDFSVGRAKLHKKYKKYMLPLLLAYKLKFFTLIPLMMGGLVLLAGSTGLAGFFFALFAATMGLKVTGSHR